MSDLASAVLVGSVIVFGGLIVTELRGIRNELREARRRQAGGER